MPNNHPTYFVSFGFNSFVIIFLAYVILYGHKLKFAFKNNLMIFLSIPLTIGLPLICEFSDTEQNKFYGFLVMLIGIGAVNSF